MQPTQTPLPPTWLIWAAGWVALGFLAFLGVAVLYYIFTRRIDLSRLISESNGDASMSRFQLLIFTFVIAASLFLIVASPNPPRFPEDIPRGVLILLGISSTSFLVSKGIQFSDPEGIVERDPAIKITGSSTTTTTGGLPIQFKADILRMARGTVIWALDPPQGMGSIDQTGLYTPPKELGKDTPKPPMVIVKATLSEDPSLSDTEVIKFVEGA
jgi:hypothetical protein